MTETWLCNSMGTDFRRCGEIDEEMKQKLNEMHVGRLIHILSHSMRRHNPAEVMENDDLTTYAEACAEIYPFGNHAQRSLSERYRRGIPDQETHSNRNPEVNGEKRIHLQRDVRSRMPA